MAEAKGLTLRVLLQAVDLFSGPLKKFGANVQAINVGLKAAQTTGRALLPAEALAGGAWAAGARAAAAVNRDVGAGASLQDSLTKFEQVAGAVNKLQAQQEALNLTLRYGQGSWEKEIDATTRAYQIYGNMADAIVAVRAGTMLATGTHQDVIDTVSQLAATARNAQVPVAQLGDALARFYQVAGPGAAGAANTRQFERALGLALQQKIPLAKFLALAAELQKTEGPGAMRDLLTYLEPGTHPKPKKGETQGAADAHYSQRAAAIRELLGRNAADVAKMEQSFARARGASAAMAAAAGADLAQQQNAGRLAADAARAGAGISVAGPAATLAKLHAAAAGLTAKTELANQGLTAATVGAAAAAAKAVTVGGQVSSAIVSWRVIRSALEGWRVSKVADAARTAATAVSGVTTALAGSGGLSAAMSALGAAATVSVGTIAAAGASLLAGVAGGYEIEKYLLRGSKIEAWMAAHHLALASEKSTVGLKPWHVHGIAPVKVVSIAPHAAARGAVAIHLTHHSGDVHVAVAPGASKDDAVAAVKDALAAHDHDLTRKIAHALDEHDRRDARLRFAS